MDARDFRALVSGKQRGPRAAIARLGLRCLELPYRLVVAARNWRYDHVPNATRRVSVPVVSVGNLTAGGVGKTPLVVWLARWYGARGLRVCIVSRGYRARDRALNDEALELAQQLPDVPHVQNPDRLAAATEAIRDHGAQLILLDDAFQHRRIGRDLNLVVVDALEPFGYDHLLPRGLLREPVASVRRADAVILSRADAVSPAARERIWQRLGRHRPDLARIEAHHAPTGFVDRTGSPFDWPAEQSAAPRGQRVLAFCGLGNPAGFRHSLATTGCTIVAWKEFPDHHRYPAEDVAALDAWARSHADVTAVVCTRKDLVKFQVATLGAKPLVALAVGLEIVNGGEELGSLLGRVVR